MLILGVALFMAVAIAALALLYLPGLRAHAQAAWRQGSLALRLRCAHLLARPLVLGRAQVQQRAWLAAQAGSAEGARMVSVLPVPGRWALAALSVLLVVPGLALVLRHWHVYDGFDHTRSRETDARVVTLLRGEQLVPPPRLPPELFSTREVEQARPLAAAASRQWELLHPEFRQRLLEVFQVMRERHGYEMVLIEGYRSPERQMQLASLGRHVTHAGAGQSYHQFGLAADCAFLRDGRVVLDERDPWAAQGYALYGAVAHSVGLQWGGAWRSLLDLGHVELPRPGRLQRGWPPHDGVVHGNGDHNVSRPFIVVGDKTDHGGVVVAGSAMTDAAGKPIARVGDKVTCPKKGHGGETVIATGDPSCIIDGQPAARHGDKTACGATLLSSQMATTD